MTIRTHTIKNVCGTVLLLTALAAVALLHMGVF